MFKEAVEEGAGLRRTPPAWLPASPMPVHCQARCFYHLTQGERATASPFSHPQNPALSLHHLCRTASKGCPPTSSVPLHPGAPPPPWWCQSVHMLLAQFSKWFYFFPTGNDKMFNTACIAQPAASCPGSCLSLPMSPSTDRWGSLELLQSHACYCSGPPHR